MIRTGILKYLKIIVSDMVDDNGNIRALPIGEIGELDLSNERIGFLRNLIKLVIFTPIVSDETKAYIKNRYVSIRNVADLMNRMESSGKKYNPNTVKSKIEYDKRKLDGIFSDSMIFSVLYSKVDISLHEKELNKQLRKYCEDEIGNSKDLLIQIPDNYFAIKLSEDAFENFLSTIAPYTRNHVKYIEESLNMEACGYFNYLMSGQLLTDEDKMRYDRIKALLGCEV